MSTYERDQQTIGATTKKNQKRSIQFYDPNKVHGQFSNFWCVDGGTKEKTLGGAWITVDGTRYRSVEHYYNAQKFTFPPGADVDPSRLEKTREYVNLLRSASSAASAKRMGNIGHKNAMNWRGGRFQAKSRLLSKKDDPHGTSRVLNDIIKEYMPHVTIRPDWDAVRDRVMWTALLAKFGRPGPLQQTLLATAGYDLCEHTEKDLYWGDGGEQGGGKNRLGQMLVAIRTGLQSGTVPKMP